MEIDGIRVRVSTTAGPGVFGFRPMNIVLPAWVLELEPSLRDLVLRHEEQHRAARDPYVLLVATLITALVPWNLPLWIQARRLRLAIEIDCDRRVLGRQKKWRPYALLLLAIAQRKTNIATQMVPALFTSTSNLELRINAMRTKATPSRLQAVALSLMTAAALTVACAVDKPESPNHLNNEARTSKQEPARTPTLVPEGASLREFQVEAPATLQETPRLKYPAALRGSGVTGEVIVQFVVDQSGSPDIRTFKVVKSPDPRLTAEVKAAVPTWRFTAATVGGKKVKQLVEQSVVFTTEKGTLSASGAPKG